MSQHGVTVTDPTSGRRAWVQGRPKSVRQAGYRQFLSIKTPLLSKPELDFEAVQKVASQYAALNWVLCCMEMLPILSV